MRKQFSKFYGFLTLVGLFLTVHGFGAVAISSEYIVVSGYDDDGVGRIIVQLTKGDPSTDRDDNKFILFNDMPPTSYATFVINGKIMKFGDPRFGNFTTKFTKDKERLYCVWKSNEGVEITFICKIVKGPTTGRLDTVHLIYQAKNLSAAEKKIGARMMLDTYLGNNDGAPFSIPGVGTFQTEREILKKDMPAYWYTMDSISKPTVRAQGTLFADDITTPDKIQFAAYKRLEPEPWGYKVRNNHEFKIWIDPPDSAVAMYWFESTVAPGKAKKISTYYGIYGATLDAGRYFNVSIGCPVKVKLDKFDASADIESVVAEGPVKDMKVALMFRKKGEKIFLGDKYFKFSSPQTYTFGALNPRGVVRVSWKPQATKSSGGTYEMVVKINGIVNKKAIEQITAREIIIDHVPHTDNPQGSAFDMKRLSALDEKIDAVNKRIDTARQTLVEMRKAIGGGE